MVDDKRSSRNVESGTATFAAGDSGTSKDVVTVRDEVDLSVHDYLITYSGAGGTEAVVELYDDAEGTSEANLTGKFDEIHISPGDKENVNGIVRNDVRDDVVAVVRDNDDEVAITVGTLHA